MDEVALSVSLGRGGGVLHTGFGTPACHQTRLHIVMSSVTRPARGLSLPHAGQSNVAPETRDGIERKCVETSKKKVCVKEVFGGRLQLMERRRKERQAIDKVVKWKNLPTYRADEHGVHLIRERKFGKRLN